MKEFTIDKNKVINTPFGNHFARNMLVLKSGKGAMIQDISGKKYLDFGAGIAVSALGHGRKDLAKTAYDQMCKVTHTSNYYTTEPTLELASRLLGGLGFHAVHFGNSGSEANEAAIKFARAYSLRTKGAGNEKLLCFTNSFHGRTYGALSVTSKKKYKDPFLPMVPGVVEIEFNNSKLLEKTLDSTFAAVVVESIQGEGGINVMQKEFATFLNKLCEKHNVILIADEVQVGLGRVGYLSGCEAVGLNADIMTLAKPLAGGLPISACLFSKKIDDLIKPGEHGTTFGGNPVAAAVAVKVWDEISSPAFLANVKKKGMLLKEGLQKIAAQHPGNITEVRSAGLLAGLVIGKDTDADYALCDAIKEEAEKLGLLVLTAGHSILRIAPPLIVTEKDIAHALKILEKSANSVFGKGE